MPFLTDDFLLQNEPARRLYHDYAAPMPIIDYHNHLPPDQVAQNHTFGNLTQIWLYGDHYKWRAMRTNGIEEHYITGPASDYEKFEQWAATVPATIRNPLFHWTHLELQRYFGISDLLTPDTARRIFDECSEKLQSPEYSTQGLLRRMNVEVIGTTDDPTDSLEHHAAFAGQNAGFRMVPTYRPDKAMNPANTPDFQTYVHKLAKAAGQPITNFDSFLKVLTTRADWFAQMGGCASDHGLETIDAKECDEVEVAKDFERLMAGQTLLASEVASFRSAMLLFFGRLVHRQGWVQQFHLGAMRNNNTRMFRTLGPDTGWDSIGDFSQARALSRHLDRLDCTDQLAKTILYNLNPADNDLFATLIGNFQASDSQGRNVPGKLQFGSGWWFLDQKKGMEAQLDSLSNMGLLSRFVGMLTDSRSFLSFPRHEYFRRILCNVIGTDVANGELPHDLPFLGGIVQDICYRNAKAYFNF
jgi:glucuronate isomerase